MFCSLIYQQSIVETFFQIKLVDRIFFCSYLVSIFITGIHTVPDDLVHEGVASY